MLITVKRNGAIKCYDNYKKLVKAFESKQARKIYWRKPSPDLLTKAEKVAIISIAVAACGRGGIGIRARLRGVF